MIKWLQSLLIGGLALDIPGGIASITQRPLNAQSPSTFVSKPTVEWLDDLLQRYDIPGLGIGLIVSPWRAGVDWKTEFLSFGHKDHEYRPYEMDSTFHIADNSKHFVALSIGWLIHNETVLPNGEKLGYDTKIVDILPDWDLVDEYAREHIDVLDLLSMRSGIPQHYQSYGLQDPAEHVRQLGRLRPSTEIRQEFQYNDHHYWVMAEVVRHLTSIPIAEFVKQQFFEPLGLTATTVNHTAAAESGNLAVPYLRKDVFARGCQDQSTEGHNVNPRCFGDPIPTEWYAKGSGLHAPGPVVSSFTDMLKWVKELLDPKYIPQHVIAETHQSIVPAFSDKPSFDEKGSYSYGLAQVTHNYRGHEIIHHIGIQPGAGSAIVRVPALGIGIVLALNEAIVGHALIDPIIYRLLDSIFGLEPIDWESRLAIPQLFRKPTPTTGPPKRPRAPPESHAVLGIYHDEAYGYLNVSRIDDVDFEITPHDILEAYTQARPDQPKPDYVALMDNVFSRGMILTHFDGPLYNATHIVTRKELDGDPFLILPHFHTAVISGGGIGMFDNFWMAGFGKKAVEDAVEEEAEVWFAKVNKMRTGFMVPLTILALGLFRPALSFPFASLEQTPLVADVADERYPIVSEDTTRYIDHLRKRYGLKGLTVAVVAGPAYTRSEGWLNQTISLGEADVAGTEVTDETLFAIASNSKLFTSVATQILIANNTTLNNGARLKLSTKVKDILGDEWVLKDKYAEERVDLIDLLSMRSGLPSHDYSIDDVDPAETVRTLRHLEPSADVHQAWQYSNLHYLTLAHIVSTLSGMPFDEYVAEHIFKPLGMLRTMYNFTLARHLAGQGGMVDSFIRVGRNVTRCGEIWRLTGGWPIDGETLEKACIGETVGVGWWSESDGLNNAGPWGIVTCAQDMVKWVREMIEPSPKLVKRSLDMYAVPLGHNEATEFGVATYGLGQWSYTYRGHQVYGHTGGLPGASSLLYTLPQAGLGLMIAVNDVTFAKEVYDTIAYRVVDELLGENPIIDWEGRFMRDEFGDQKAIGPRPPADPRPAVFVGGSYHHPGYGTFQLDSLASSKGEGVPAAVIDALDSSDFKLNTTSVYLSHWNKPFANYVSFSHFDGPLYNWTILGVYNRSEAGMGERREVAVVHNAGPAVFTEDGIGMFGNWYDAGPTIEEKPIVEDARFVREASEVWFDKVTSMGS